MRVTFQYPQTMTISGPNSDGHEFICFAQGALYFCSYTREGPSCYWVEIVDYVAEGYRRHKGRVQMLAVVERK